MKSVFQILQCRFRLHITIGSYEWIGNWQLNGDSLVVVFDRLISFYSFTLKGMPSTVLGKLPAPLVFIFSPDKMYPILHQINTQEDKVYIFEREESE